VKLNIVPARTGILWVKLGLRTFFKQPLALAGLFFMYFMAITLLGLIPLLGTAAALLLAPAATLGIMAAAREAADGRFPMPMLLFTAFRAGAQRTRAMLTLGALYAVALLVVLGVASLVGGAPAAPVPAADPNALPRPELSAGLLVIVLLQLPLVVVFAHAPALVHWHDLTPVKALFFSLVAFGRNIGAYVVFGVAWAFVLVGIVLAVVLLLQLLGATLSIANLMPVALVVGAMGTCSMYFTYRDSYLTPDAGEAAPPNPAPEETP
jgi:hypothetical protein